ncbi:MAG TPA: glycine zipper domain-containing protein, partial [Pirellulales bacterium]
MSRALYGSFIAILLFSAGVGCHSPYYADQGALAGGVGGAGLGALIGSASGHTGAGAVIGAAAGALTGGAVGGALDNIDAKNRAQIAAATGHPPTAVSVNDIIALTRSGIDEQIIVNQLASSGLQRPLQANDVIYLQQNGV